MRLCLPAAFRLVLAVLLLGLTARPLIAASYLATLEKSRGKEVRWNAAWSKDKADHNVIYKVVSVKVKNRIPLRRVTLRLRSRGSAVVRERRIVAEAEDKARAIIERFVNERPDLKFPKIDSGSGGDTGEEVVSGGFPEKEELPFITYSSEGWVRDYRPHDKRLVSCKIGQARYVCTHEDNLRYGGALKTAERELRWLTR